MNRNRLFLACLFLPLVVLGLLVARNEIGLARGQEFTLPIEGYDPRDPLRGRYLQFALMPERIECTGGDCTLCLEKTAIVLLAEEAQCDAEVDQTASALSLQQGPSDSYRIAGRFFVSEARAPALEAELRRQPMEARVKLTPGGRLVVLDIAPRQTK